MAVALRIEQVSKRFGGLISISDLSIEVPSQEIVSIIGPNGAGKTTLFNIITGVYRPDSGRVVVAGSDVTGLAPSTIATMGVARTFQNVRLFHNLTVIDNVMAAMYGRTHAGLVASALGLPRARREEARVREEAKALLSFFGSRLMGYRWEQPAYSLSYANRRRLEIARAMATGANILLLDEPAAGMNPKETHEITEVVARLRQERGHTIVIIEHDMHVVEGVSDRVVALDHGVKIAEGDYAAVATDPHVVESYLGRGTAGTK
jgi:branched-chain amino acid transport system ATP-binding protein